MASLPAVAGAAAAHDDCAHRPVPASTSVGPETRATILESLTRAIRQCPTVRACRIGRRVRHGLPGYEQQMREDYQCLVLLEFDDPDGLRAYLNTPRTAPSEASSRAPRLRRWRMTMKWWT